MHVGMNLASFSGIPRGFDEGKGCFSWGEPKQGVVFRTGFGSNVRFSGFVSHHLKKYLLEMKYPQYLGDVPIGHIPTPVACFFPGFQDSVKNTMFSC